MRRTSLPPRRTRLRSSGPPRRSSTPIKPGRRHRKCYDHLRDPAFKTWARETHACTVAGRAIQPGVFHRCAGILEFAHVISEGLGGADRGNGIILCTAAHTGEPWAWHRGHKSFQRRFGIDATAIARALEAEYAEEWLQ